jgi:hypothetical protein
VGQKRREFGTDKTVLDVRAGAAKIRSSAIGVNDEWIPCDTITRLDRWEYLGMAESADGDWRTATGEALDREAKRNGFARSIGDTDEQLRARFSDPESAADRLHAAIHASDKREPITNRQVTLKAVDPGPGAANTRDVYVEDYLYRLRENGYEVVKRAVAEQFKKAIKTNAANVARRANEEAAKRLIANPPEWAYPKAWMCAVLWCMEQHGDRSALLDSLDGGAAWMFIGLYQRLRGEGMTHESAIDKATKREVPIARDVVNAYARGMERPSPLMGRPGVKGGISTCDLGVDYE